MKESNIVRTWGMRLLLVCAVVFGVFFASRADAYAASYKTITVTASEMKSKGAAAAIQEALDTAKEKATSSKPYKIVVEEGSYTLTDTLNIYSNTYLYAKGVTFTQKSGVERNMIKVGDTEDETATGYYYKNITIYGGTWNENGNSNTLIKIGHAANVTIKNATFKNVVDAHLMEVAGIDGLVISGCTFKDQTLTGTKSDESIMTNEAIQLDILVEKHFSGYLSEDLALKDVEITGCTFSNVPRGVGSHTGVINNPIDGLTITGNTFKNLTSCGIQLMSVKNCTISDNTMTNVPRGIYIYSYVWSGTYLGSTLKAEDSTGTATSSSYKTPSSSKIVISGNTITMSGKDKYADYENAGIWLQGFELTSSKKYNGGKVPSGNYYLTGVTVKDNTITTTGQGIRLSNVANSKITGNTITGPGASKSSYYGISTLNESKKNTISSNTITSFYRGIYIYGESTVSTIESNTISDVGNTAIWISDATVTKVKSNTITSPTVNGIYVYDGAKVTYIKSNKITSPGKYGIDIEDATATYIQKNTVSKAASHSIMVFDSAKVQEISGNKITSGKARGLSISSLKCDLTIKSNTISKCADYQIYLNPSTTKYTITVSSNTITGSSKKKIGIRADNGTIVLKSNTIKSCSYPVQFLNEVKGSIYKNTLSSNKTNKYLIGSSKTYSNLSAPTLTISATKSTSVKLTWTKVSGSGYQIYRATSKSGTYKKVKSVSSSSTKSYTNTGLTKGKTYYYKVRAYRKVGNTTFYSSYSSVKSATTSK